MYICTTCNNAVEPREGTSETHCPICECETLQPLEAPVEDASEPTEGKKRSLLRNPFRKEASSDK